MRYTVISEWMLIRMFFQTFSEWKRKKNFKSKRSNTLKKVDDSKTKKEYVLQNEFKKKLRLQEIINKLN